MIESFAPIVDAHSRILILGSIPSVKSLEASQYYAHPQNAFWFIMSQLFGFQKDIAYEARLKILLRHGVALYDVIGTCERKGSLDSAIKKIQHQDFREFFQSYPNIEAVCCNGAKAYREFTKIYNGDKAIYPLPSTSPAFAKMRKEEKLEKWRIITEI
ncbi:DNA-deoxyinosine glycosylase [Sulfurospirillum sp. 1612]|uniref:DNA-deoxyinosine glycosylase n=1 Tax=Sulfurospirillum sp. 1612 TaxID=3094835 RepID=UPI002F92A6A5